MVLGACSLGCSSSVLDKSAEMSFPLMAPVLVKCCSHLRFMSEVASVKGALVLCCVYSVVIGFPNHSLLELPFWYSSLALQPEEECTLHVH